MSQRSQQPSRREQRAARWRQAERVRARWSDDDFEAEDERLAIEIAAFPVTRCDPTFRLEAEK